MQYRGHSALLVHGAINRPLAWVAVGFAAGTYAAASALPSGTLLLVCAASLVGTSLLFRSSAARLVARLFLLFFLVAVLNWRLRVPLEEADVLERYSSARPDALHLLEGAVSEAPLFPGDYCRFVLELESITTRGVRTATEGRVLVRWSAPSFQLFDGDRVRVQARLTHALSPVNHGVDSYEVTLHRRRIYSAAEVDGAAVELQSRPGWSLRHWLSRLRAAEAEALRASMPARVFPLVSALWLGERSDIDPSMREAFLVSGTTHLLSVSGVHASIIFASTVFVLGIFVRSRKRRSICCALLLILFTLLTGACIPMVRVTLMLLLYLAAEMWNREPDAPTALGAAALLFLFLQPTLLFDAGFILSFLSVASLLLFTNPIAAVLPKLPATLRQAIAAVLAVQILPLPFAILFFHNVPLLGPLANLLVIPLASVFLWLCMAATVSLLVYSPVAILFGHALAPISDLMLGIIRAVAAVPGGHLLVPSPSAAAVVLYFLASFALYIVLHPTISARRRMGGVAIAALIASVVVWRPGLHDFEVDFLDVGHGDATFVRSGAGTALIDGGDANEFTDMGARVVAPFLLSHGVRRLDYVILTHDDRDHGGGLQYILDNFSVGALVLGPLPPGAGIESSLVSLCHKRGITVHHVKRGDVLPLDDFSIEVLHPSPEFAREHRDNDNSLVLRLQCGDLRVLLPGDVEAAAEAAVAAAGCQADIVKAPHHGSGSSSTMAFVSAVAARDVIISTKGSERRSAVGAGVEERYGAHNTRVWRTDQCGGVRLRRTHQRYVLESARSTDR